MTLKSATPPNRSTALLPYLIGTTLYIDLSTNAAASIIAEEQLVDLFLLFVSYYFYAVSLQILFQYNK